ncbi:MAG TPA: aldo/keto reductase [Phycisphaerae bacterium]|nr:aldo/keto reductase [Phycisphaerae bacterium]
MSTSRRDFLATTLTAAAAVGIAAARRPAWGQAASEPALADIPELKTPESTKQGDMLYRTLGKTGEKVSLLAVGGAHLNRDEFAVPLVRKAIDNGVTFMDNCWDYGNPLGRCEERMGEALKDGYRKKVFLMTKLDGRSKAAAARQLEESLKRLQTDVIDLIQFHEVNRASDPGLIFGRDGAMDAMLEAKKAGKVRYIGFTGHKDPEFHVTMLETAKKNDFHFDTVQMPLNLLDAHYHSFARGVVPRLVKDGTGVLAMKTLAAGQIPRANLGVTSEDCLHYAMNLPTSTVIVGMDSLARLDEALAAVKSFKPLDKAQLAALLEKTRTVALTGRLETFKTTNQFDGIGRHPEWMGTT